HSWCFWTLRLLGLRRPQTTTAAVHLSTNFSMRESEFIPLHVFVGFSDRAGQKVFRICPVRQQRGATEESAALSSPQPSASHRSRHEHHGTYRVTCSLVACSRRSYMSYMWKVTRYLDALSQSPHGLGPAGTKPHSDSRRRGAAGPSH